MTELLKFLSRPRLRNPVMLVAWEADAGQLGTGVLEYLKEELKGDCFCEIDPVDFFPLNGVAIENNLMTFPQSVFYAFPDHDLIALSSTIPRYEWFKFLNCVMDVAQEHYHVRELYTVGGMISFGAHTTPRDFWASFNSPQIKKSLVPYQLSRETDFETPPGGRPTLNSFVLWTAKRRSINGANLWVPVPFYLVADEDPRGQKKVLEFLDSRLDLRLDFTRLDTDISRQNAKIAQLRQEMPDIDRSINKLENNLRLTEEEHEKLVKEVEEYLRKK